MPYSSLHSPGCTNGARTARVATSRRVKAHRNCRASCIYQVVVQSWLKRNEHTRNSPTWYVAYILNAFAVLCVASNCKIKASPPCRLNQFVIASRTHVIQAENVDLDRNLVGEHKRPPALITSEQVGSTEGPYFVCQNLKALNA